MLYRRIIIQPGSAFYSDPEPQAPLRAKYYTHILLFVATLVTTTVFGAMMAGAHPFSDIRGMLAGLPFSLSLLFILGVHEFGHYFAAKYWRVSVTLPYFIPAPLPPIGTFGAVIRMKSTIPSRKALVELGVAGPLAGFIVAIAITIVGLKLSTIVPASSVIENDSFLLGESLLFKGLSWLVLGPLPADQEIVLHPMGFAGWLGFFVTALNLIPFGQLDGGHIVFALSPRVHEFLRQIRIPVMLLMGLTLWSGWYLWAFILLLVGGPHPYPDVFEQDIGILRKALAIVAILMFLLCIIPIPIIG